MNKYLILIRICLLTPFGCIYLFIKQNESYNFHTVNLIRLSALLFYEYFVFIIYMSFWH